MCPCLGGALSALPGSVHSFSHNAVSCEHRRWREVAVQIALIQLLYITEIVGVADFLFLGARDLSAH